MHVGTPAPRLVKSSKNILLRRLSQADQILLETGAFEIATSRRATLFRSGESLEYFYFPDSANFSLIEGAGCSRLAEIAVIGREGMLGWPALLGCDHSTHEAICSTRGTVLCVPVIAMRLACVQSQTLWPALLQFVHVIIVQMARAIASHLRDSLDHRLARWLLMRHDRVGGDILLVHHDEIADRLAVRRASITDSLHILEGDRLIRCNRGRILIRDRDALESFAGDSYGLVESHYRDLIAPFGKSLIPCRVN